MYMDLVSGLFAYSAFHCKLFKNGVLNKLSLFKEGNAFPNRRSRIPSLGFCQLMSLSYGYI